MASAKNDALVEYFLQRRQRGFEYRQYFQPNMVRNWQGYMNMRPRPKIPNEYWRARTRVPDEWRMVETVQPQHLINAFRSNQWYSVRSPSGGGQVYEQVVWQLLFGGWNRADGFTKTMVGSKYAMICGTAPVKVYWKVKRGPVEMITAPDGTSFDGDELPSNLSRTTREETVFRGPDFYFLDNFRFLIDPTGNDMWAMEYMPLDTDQLEWENEQYHGRLYDPTELRKAIAFRKKIRNHTPGFQNKSLIPSTGSLGGAPLDVQSLTDRVEGIPDQTSESQTNTWQDWVWVPPRVHRYTDGTSQWRMVMIADDQFVLRDVEAPTPDRRHPYFLVQSIPIPGRLYGESPLTWVSALSDIRNFIEDARREEVIQKLWQKFIVDKQSDLSPGRLFHRPGGMLWVGNHLGNIKDSIIPVPQSDVMSSSYSESAVKEDQMDRAMGATDIVSGTPLGGRATATEANILASFGSGRYQLATMWFDETFKRQVLKRMFNLYRSRLTQPEIVQLSGTPAERLTVDLRTLLWDVDIHVDTGAFGSIDQQLLNTYLQLYALFANNPRAELHLNHEEIIRDAFVRAGDWKADRHVRSSQEVQSDVAQQAALGQQQFGQQIQGQQAIDANRELARGLASSLAQRGDSQRAA